VRAAVSSKLSSLCHFTSLAFRLFRDRHRRSPSPRRRRSRSRSPRRRRRRWVLPRTIWLSLHYCLVIINLTLFSRTPPRRHRSRERERPRSPPHRSHKHHDDDSRWLFILCTRCVKHRRWRFRYALMIIPIAERRRKQRSAARGTGTNQVWTCAKRTNSVPGLAWNRSSDVAVITSTDSQRRWCRVWWALCLWRTCFPAGCSRSPSLRGTSRAAAPPVVARNEWCCLWKKRHEHETDSVSLRF